MKNFPGVTRIERDKLIHLVAEIIEHQARKEEFASDAARKEAKAVEGQTFDNLPPCRMNAKLLEKRYGAVFMCKAKGWLGHAGAKVLWMGESFRKAPEGGYCKQYAILSQDRNLVEVEIRWQAKYVEEGRIRREAEEEAGLRAEIQWAESTIRSLAIAPDWKERCRRIRKASRRISARQAMVRLGKGEIRPSVDKNGRLHHVLTNAPREVRKLLSLDGENLVSLDFSACHPYLLIAEFPSPTDEVEKLHRYVHDGDFYTLIAGEDLSMRRRKKAKIQFNTALNDQTWRSRKNPLYWRFAQEFPQITARIEDVKGTDHRAMANRLQRRESDLFIKGMLQKCMDQGLKVFPIHDSLYCKESEADQVLAIMREVAIKAVRFEPVIKQELVA